MSTGPQRRAKGGGSIRQRTKGSWEVRYYGPPDDDGNRKRVYESVRGSRRDADRVLRERVGTVENGSFVEKSKETVTEFLWRWMDIYSATNNRLRTQQGYRTIIRRIVPMIGAIPLRGLQPQHIQKMYADLLDRDCVLRLCTLPIHSSKKPSVTQ